VCERGREGKRERSREKESEGERTREKERERERKREKERERERKRERENERKCVVRVCKCVGVSVCVRACVSVCIWSPRNTHEQPFFAAYRPSFVRCRDYAPRHCCQCYEVRAIKCRSLLRKMTYKDKGSYKSSPPCKVFSQSMSKARRVYVCVHVCVRSCVTIIQPLPLSLSLSLALSFH